MAGVSKVFCYDFGNDWTFSIRNILMSGIRRGFFSEIFILRFLLSLFLAPFSTSHYPIIRICIFVQKSLKLDELGQIFLSSLLNYYVSLLK